MNNKEIIEKVEKLVEMYKNGALGGEVMPEDSNPHLPKETIENYNYYTLPMALNYQRNSYKLWESANDTWNDPETNFVFDTKKYIHQCGCGVEMVLKICNRSFRSEFYKI